MANFYGGSGNDTNAGSIGSDLSYGGAGNDSLSGGTGNDSLSGGLGNDVVDGGADNDVIVGGRGNDTFYGGAGNDEIIGDGQLYDPLSYASGLLGLPTTLHVVNLADGPITLSYIDLLGNQQDVATIAAGQTYNYATLTSANFFLLGAHGYYLDVIQGGNQTFTYSGPFADVLYGGDGDDNMLGQTGNDTLYGDAGNDTLDGGYGDDSLSGGLGNDSLLGEAGNDTIYGGGGVDSLDAGSGNDLVYAGSGNDSVLLGDGNDVFGDWSIDDSGDDTIYGGLGDDSIIGGAGNDVVYGGDGADWLSGQDGNDTLYGGEGADTFVISDDHNGDTIFGGETGWDHDALLFSTFASTQGVTVTFSATEAGSYSFAGTAGSGAFSEIEVVYGTGFNDTLNGAAAPSGLSLYGEGGADSITGGSGNDTIYFGSGNDSVFGGAGNDIIDDTSGAQESGSNLIYGGSGEDSIWTGGGNDTVYGDAGNDVIWGEDGKGLLFGGAGNDSIYGGGGADTLIGGSGNDSLSGGAGNDVFRFADGDGVDVVSDFDLALTAGVTADQLDVSAVLRADFAPVKVWDVRVLDDGSGNARLLFPSGEVVVMQGVSPATLQQPGMLHAMGVPCFVRGTRIATPQGARRVEQIAQGDLVLTKGGAAVPVIWRGGVQIAAAELAQRPMLRPVRLPAVTGHAQLWLSPQHGVFLAQRGALARAGHLADFGLARWQERPEAVVYHHLLLPQHALICAEGQWCESFYPGPMALAMLGPAARIAVTGAIFGQALTAHRPLTGDVLSLYGERCLPLLSRRDLRLWFARPGESPPPALGAALAKQLEHPLP